MSIDDLLDEGIQHQEQGRLSDARRLYEAAIAIDPLNPDALHLLGLVFHTQGEHDEAIKLIRKAIEIDSEAAFYYHNLAEAYAAKTSAVEAAAEFAHAVRLDPTLQQSWHRYIECLINSGQTDAARDACDAAHAMFAYDDQILSHLGTCLRIKNLLPEASKAYQKAMQLAPLKIDHVRNFALCLLSLKDPETAEAARILASVGSTNSDALTTAASILVDMKCFQDAYEIAQQAVRLTPDSGQAQFLFGFCLLDFNMNEAAFATLNKAALLMPHSEKAYVLLGMAGNRLDYKAEAFKAFEHALALNPQSIDALVNYAVMKQGDGENDKAFGYFKTAFDLDNDHPQANLGVGVILHRRGSISEAEKHIRKCLKRSPKNAEALAALGHNLAEQGRIAEGMEATQQACDLKPELSYAHNNRLFFSLYDYRLTADERSKMHREWGQSKSHPPVPHGKRPDTHRRLRIGYVSADFRGHAVSFFIEPVLENHDHSRFEIYCYSDVKETDLVTERIKRWADHWISISGKSDMEVAAQIEHDEIDVLVDLVSHTADGRLGVFALRPALVQVSYIGYPWSTGLEAIGYRISDPLLDPEGPDDALYVEKTIRLDAFWCYRPMELCPPIAPSPALAGEPFTFGSFNNVSKLNDRVLEVWARILAKVPGSHLMLKYKGLDDPAIAERILSTFEKAGISRERIELFALSSLVQHMAQHNHVDLALDPFPFNGGTTSFHSSYMGVPLITLEGRGQAERMGSAILRHLGYSELVATTVDEYVDLAVTLANDLPRTEKIRSSLRQRMKNSPLMDAARHTHQLEAAFTRIYAEQTETASAHDRENRALAANYQIEIFTHPSADGKIKFSIVVCGRNADRFKKSRNNFEQLFGAAGLEYIYVLNPSSLASGYNAGIAKCSADIVIFCHDDIEILNTNAAEIIQRHLATHDVVVVAGTDRLTTGSWISSGQPHIFGQVAQPLPIGEGFALLVYGEAGDAPPKIEAGDGLFFAVRREVLTNIRFDADTFDGFHLYDIDFSFSAFLASYKIAVAMDLFIIHESGGKYDLNWHAYHRRFATKHGASFLSPVLAKPEFQHFYVPTKQKLIAMMEKFKQPRSMVPTA